MSILAAPASAGSSVLDPITAAIKHPFSTTVQNNGERGNDFPGGFTIQEYSGGQPLDGTVNFIQLLGNMMPMQPFPWEGEQRLTTEYYPGNPEPSVQVLGPKEGPVTIHGRFKDKRYRDASLYGASYNFALALDEMRKRGNLIHFGMSGEGGKWMRWGFIEKVSYKMNKLSWVDYEITFLVVSEAQPINNYFSSPDKDSPSTVNEKLLAEAVSFQLKYSAIPTSMPLSIADLLNGLVSDVAKSVNLVTNFISTVMQVATDIESSAFRALGLVKNARASLVKFRRQFDTITQNFHTISHSGSPSAQVSDTYKNLSFMKHSVSDSVGISIFLAQIQAQLLAITQTVPKARYKTVKGDTLQNISVKFYGKPDNWSKIYDHNHLTSTDLDNGTWKTKPVLEIPNV